MNPLFRWTLFLCLSVSAHAQVPEPSPEKPLNFVLVLVDDMGWTDLACQGSEYYQTPNIDKLAGKGMRFTDAYAACAVCSPTRAAVMTGRSPARTGVTDWIRAKFQRATTVTPEKNPTKFVGGPGRKLLCPPNPFWLEKKEITLAEMLRRAGYATCHIGKWHLGDDDWFPQHQGFDLNFGGCDFGQPPSYFDPYTNRDLPDGIPFLPPRKEGEYLTDREADEAVQFIKDNREQPFFLYLAHYAVHTPIQARVDVTKKYQAREKTLQKNATYAAMVESVDDALGRVVAALDESGVAERTVIIFTSDNGGLVGPTHNAPLRSGKGYPYEGGIRVPLIIRWPGVVDPGTVSHEPVTSVDFFPTILDLIGVKPPARLALDGVSLKPHLLSQGTRRIDRDTLYWHFPHYRHSPGPYSIIRKGDWKMIKYYEGPVFELYNLKEDLSETTNLSIMESGRVRMLDAQLKAHLRSVRAKVPRLNPNFRP